MNFFQEQLKRLISECDNASEVKYVGRAAFICLGNDTNIKAEFTTFIQADHYEAIRLTALSGMEKIDCTLIRFSDYCTPKGRNNVIPHIWSYDGNYKWYVEPSNHEISNIADSIDEYISLFSPTQNQDFGVGLTY